MDDIYSNHFVSHAHDILWRLKLEESEIREELAEKIPMSAEHKLDLADHLALFRSRCCKESFALGVELGQRIAWEFSER